MFREMQIRGAADTLANRKQTRQYRTGDWRRQATGAEYGDNEVRSKVIALSLGVYRPKTQFALEDDLFGNNIPDQQMYSELKAMIYRMRFTFPRWVWVLSLLLRL